MFKKKQILKQQRLKEVVPKECLSSNWLIFLVYNYTINFF